MTVAELIERLREFDPQLEVSIVTLIGAEPEDVGTSYDIIDIEDGDNGDVVIEIG